MDKRLKNTLKAAATAAIIEAARQIIVNTAQDYVTNFVFKFYKRNEVWVQIDHDNDLFSAMTAFLSKKVPQDDVQKLKAGVMDSYQTKYLEKENSLIISPGEDELKLLFEGVTFDIQKSEPAQFRGNSRIRGGITTINSGNEEKPGYRITTHKRNREKLIQLLETAFNDYYRKEPKGASIYYTRWGTDFQRAATNTLRPWKSVVLQDSKRTSLENHIEEFFDSKDWYIERGIPYRKGFLLHGPPGTGKTSIVKGLAEKYNLDIYIISFSGQSFDESTLTDLFNDIPQGVIVLFEDIDGLFRSREKGEQRADEHSPISFRGFINLLDGVMSPEGVLVFMTTNYIDKLDEALIRPGRCDVRMEIGYINEDMAKDFFRFFYKNVGEVQEELVEEFWKIIKDIEELSISVLQSYLARHRDKPKEAIQIKNFKEFYEDYKNKDET